MYLMYLLYFESGDETGQTDMHGSITRWHVSLFNKKYSFVILANDLIFDSYFNIYTSLVNIVGDESMLYCVTVKLICSINAHFIVSFSQ